MAKFRVKRAKIIEFSVLANRYFCNRSEYAVNGRKNTLNVSSLRFVSCELVIFSSDILQMVFYSTTQMGTFSFVCVCVCVCVCMRMCVYVHVYVHVYVYVCVYVHVYVCVYMCMYVCDLIFVTSKFDEYVMHYTAGILQRLDTDVHSAVTAKTSTAL